MEISRRLLKVIEGLQNITPKDTMLEAPSKSLLTRSRLISSHDKEDPSTEGNKIHNDPNLNVQSINTAVKKSQYRKYENIPDAMGECVFDHYSIGHSFEDHILDMAIVCKKFGGQSGEQVKAIIESRTWHLGVPRQMKHLLLVSKAADITEAVEKITFTNINHTLSNYRLRTIPGFNFKEFTGLQTVMLEDIWMHHWDYTISWLESLLSLFSPCIRKVVIMLGRYEKHLTTKRAEHQLKRMKDRLIASNNALNHINLLMRTKDGKIRVAI